MGSGRRKKQPGAVTWFEFRFPEKYPEFDRWEKREENSSIKPDLADKNNIA
jgi:hypothetical protein